MRRYAHVGYAFSQIKKARGQNKWINQPKPEAPPRKEDFCHVLTRECAGGSWQDAPCRPVTLERSGIAPGGIATRPAWNMRRMFSGCTGSARRRAACFAATRIALEPIPLAEERSCFRRPAPLQRAGLATGHAKTTATTGHWRARTQRRALACSRKPGELDYDAKNLMHTIRLLLSGESILLHGAATLSCVSKATQQRFAAAGPTRDAFSYGEVIADGRGDQGALRCRCVSMPICRRPRTRKQSTTC
jgi:hypothetical protein